MRGEALMSRAGWEDLWFALGIVVFAAMMVWGLRHGG